MYNLKKVLPKSITWCAKEHLDLKFCPFSQLVSGSMNKMSKSTN